MFSLCKGVFEKAYLVFGRTAGMGTISKEETWGGKKKVVSGKSRKNGSGITRGGVC